MGVENKESFIITGYTSQQDVGPILIRNELHKFLNVYTTEGSVYRFYFQKKDDTILDPIIDCPSNYMRSGRIVGIGKVKGLCVVIGSLINNRDVNIYDLRFLPRNIPKHIIEKMNLHDIESNNIREVKQILPSTYIADFPYDKIKEAQDFYTGGDKYDDE